MTKVNNLKAININDTSSTRINTLQFWSTLAKNRVELKQVLIWVATYHVSAVIFPTVIQFCQV